MSTQKILVVDDEQNIRDILQTFLQDMGYNVASATDGFDALDKIGKEGFDLYIIDIYMPRMSGLELIARLKEVQPKAVIIVMTGYSGLDVDFRSIRQSAFMYLSKPIQPDELLRAVEAGLAQSIKVNQMKIETPEPEPVPGISPDVEKSLQHYLLRGFSAEQTTRLLGYGVLREYSRGSNIPSDKEEGSILFIERGRVGVFFQDAQIESLKEGDIWGEESFVAPKASFASLHAQEDSIVRHFSRKQLIEFLSTVDKNVIDNFMLNLMLCMHLKHRRCVAQLVNARKDLNPDQKE
ncbi:MAG: response regulator [Candidatus Cloacimonetes bacterium]|nr:response regulator [Candidatus Cloacimonadota bacterium]